MSTAGFGRDVMWVPRVGTRVVALRLHGDGPPFDSVDVAFINSSAWLVSLYYSVWGYNSSLYPLVKLNADADTKGQAHIVVVLGKANVFVEALGNFDAAVGNPD